MSTFFVFCKTGTCMRTSSPSPFLHEVDTATAIEAYSKFAIDASVVVSTNQYGAMLGRSVEASSFKPTFCPIVP